MAFKRAVASSSRKFVLLLALICRIDGFLSSKDHDDDEAEDAVCGNAAGKEPEAPAMVGGDDIHDDTVDDGVAGYAAE